MLEELIQQFKDLYFIQNKTRAEIKEILNINEYQVRKLLKISGVRKIAPKQLKKDILVTISLEEIKEYFQTHSRKATAKHFGITEQNLKDLMKKYNFHHTSQQKSLVRAKTCQEMYGVDCVLQRADVREKCESSEAITKMLNTQRKNNLEKYGVEYTWQIPEVREKSYLTKKQNHTFNSSKPEEDFYNYLCEKYSSENIIRQYRDQRYPFNCDFYVKSEDLFIELNLHWTHGGEPFNNSEKNLKLLNEWVEKSKTSDFYLRAIEIWTKRDLLKIETAKKNNLNYLVIYPNDLTICLNSK